MNVAKGKSGHGHGPKVHEIANMVEAGIFRLSVSLLSYLNTKPVTSPTKLSHITPFGRAPCEAAVEAAARAIPNGSLEKHSASLLN